MQSEAWVGVGIADINTVVITTLILGDTCSKQFGETVPFVFILLHYKNKWDENIYYFVNKIAYG